MPSRERLPAIPAEKMTAAQRQAADDFQSARGYPMLGPFQVMLRSPEVMLRAQAMGDYLRYRNVLSRRVSELVPPGGMVLQLPFHAQIVCEL